MPRYFAFFFLSGFCGLVYETVWVRLSMAQFGVTPASLSIVVSLFMAGLALGSWLVARNRERLDRMTASRAAQAYGVAELLIAGLGALVPPALKLGGHLCALMASGRNPVSWYASAASWQALVLLPATTAMGATIPLGMHAIGQARLAGSRTSFSFLYLANVLGAVVGTLATAFVLVEVCGFANTLQVALALNVGIAAAAIAFGRNGQQSGVPRPVEDQERSESQPSDSLALGLLFASGFSSLGMEVVWTRQFTPLIGTVVYSFAAILAIYLSATFLGSLVYRRVRGAGTPLTARRWALVAALGMLPVLAADLRLGAPSLYDEGLQITWSNLLRLTAGVAPFSAALGFLTPQLVDHWSGGRPNRAGLAYATNTVGCIVGPLVAGFLLLPWLSERWAITLFCLPFWLASVVLAIRARQGLWPVGLALAAVTVLATQARSFEESFPSASVQRDYTATTVAMGTGSRKRLLVNGIGMTVLTPITKVMAHLTLALLPHPPRRALTICFGMGTTFRSLLSWGIDVTAVELVPGVPKLFGFFHPDGNRLLRSPRAHVVIDDGRRFLESGTDLYDAIIIDPPPPIWAASSSLLYSREFYAAARKRLAPGGILQQWIPGGDADDRISMSRALEESFPYVIAFHGFNQGVHLFASMEPFVHRTPEELAARLPPAAAIDYVEWGPGATSVDQMRYMLESETAIESPSTRAIAVPTLTDDRPFNEYYFLRLMRATR